MNTQDLIAPCGMNCALCLSYQFGIYNLNRHGFHRRYCPGCLPRNRGCLFLGKDCEKLKNSAVRFCYFCIDFPCQSLKVLDKRYRDKYNMSMIENLRYVQEHGIDDFLKKEAEKWRCDNCGAMHSCHCHQCLSCEAESFLNKYKGK